MSDMPENSETTATPATPATPVPYAVFDEIRHLVAALHLYAAKSSPVFPKILRVGGSRLAVPLDLFHPFAQDDRERRAAAETMFNRLCVQCGWKAEIIGQCPEGAEFAIVDLLASSWKYIDSLKANENRGSPAWDTDARRQMRGGLSREGLFASGEHDVAITHYDPLHPGMHYILGSTGIENASALLERLTATLTRGIRAIPQFMDPRGEREGGFSFFWLVHGDAPPYSVLQTAERAWWGPVGTGAVQIYEEWPYESQIPPSLLNRLDWGEGAEIVLLSRDAPHVMSFAFSPDAPDLSELIDVASLHMRDREHMQAVITPFRKEALDFAVQVRLVPESPLYRQERRMKELEQEIAAKEELLERLRAQVESLEGGEEATEEPLFIYQSDGGQVPYELEKLLIEWSDQPEDLGQLWYLKVDGSTLPMGMIGEGKEVHVLTTATALGKSGWASAAGMRLRSYAPRSGGLCAFTFLPEWGRHGLRVFIPRRLYLELYPQMRPGAISTGKLAAALFEGSEKGAGDSVALMIPFDQNRTRACILSNDDFVPLMNVLEWKCALDVMIDFPTIARSFIEKSSAVLISSIEESFRLEVAQEAHKRLEVRREQLKGAIAGVNGEADRLAARIDEIEGQVRDLDRMVSGVFDALNEVHGARSELESGLDAISGDMEKTRVMLGRLEKLQGDLRRLGGISSELRRDGAKSQAGPAERGGERR